MSSTKSVCLYPSRVIIVYYYPSQLYFGEFCCIIVFFSRLQECNEKALLSAQSGDCTYWLAAGPVHSAPVFSYGEEEVVSS